MSNFTLSDQGVKIELSPRFISGEWALRRVCSNKHPRMIALLLVPMMALRFQGGDGLKTNGDPQLWVAASRACIGRAAGRRIQRDRVRFTPGRPDCIARDNPHEPRREGATFVKLGDLPGEPDKGLTGRRLPAAQHPARRRTRCAPLPPSIAARAPPALASLRASRLQWLVDHSLDGTLSKDRCMI